MGRVIIGAIPAGIAMFIIGFIWFGTPLAKLGYGSLDNAQAAAVQQAMAANLPKTGTYSVPGIDTAEQTNMYSQGPIATVHYNSGGFAALDGGSLAAGLLFYIFISLLLGLALIGIDRRVPDFPSRAKLVVIFAVAASAFIHFSEPIFYHHDWPHAIYLFLGDALMLAAAGLILARWFLPRQAQPAVAEDRPHSDAPAAAPPPKAE